MRPGKDTTFGDETGKEWKRIRTFDAFRKGDAEHVENISRGRSLSCTSLTLKTLLFCMLIPAQEATVLVEGLCARSFLSRLATRV